MRSLTCFLRSWYPGRIRSHPRATRSGTEQQRVDEERLLATLTRARRPARGSVGGEKLTRPSGTLRRGNTPDL